MSQAELRSGTGIIDTMSLCTKGVGDIASERARHVGYGNRGMCE